VDAGGAPERVGGLKLLPVPTPLGKLTPELVDLQARGWGDEHRAQPRVVSITQSTELGTRYSVDEIAAIVAHAHNQMAHFCNLAAQFALLGQRKRVLLLIHRGGRHISFSPAFPFAERLVHEL